MITVNLEGAESFADQQMLNDAREKAAVAYRQVLAGTGAGNEWMGWRRILKNPNESELDRIKNTANSIREKADVFIICGIGGSYLGSKAVIEALQGNLPDRKPEILFAGHHIGGLYLEQLISYLDKPNENGERKSVYLNVISKSGSTLETALSFRILREWFENTFGDEAGERIIVTTGPEGGVLNELAKLNKYDRFIIPDDVGGRFSVLTPVGLFPIAVAGIDIKALYSGAVSKFNEYEDAAEDILQYASLRYCFQVSGKALDVIGSFEPEMNAFTGWIQQLLGESEGKEGKGLFPVSAAYSTDLHSIGQMIQQGRRNMIETFLIAEESSSNLRVTGQNDDPDGLDYLSQKPFHEINRKALDGTAEAHIEGGVPVLRVILKNLNAYNVGELIYFYEMFTAVYVYMLEVNPFNQPGVEDYKKAMYRNLKKK